MAWPWEDGDYPSQTFNYEDTVKITVTPVEGYKITFCVLQVPYEGAFFDHYFTEQEDGSYTTEFNAEKEYMDRGSGCWLAISVSEIEDPNITIYWDESTYYSVTMEVVENG